MQANNQGSPKVVRIYIYGEGWTNVDQKRTEKLIKEGLATKSPSPEERDSEDFGDQSYRLITLSQFEALVKDARAKDEADYTSQARERCEAQVYDILEARIAPEFWNQFEIYCSKATLDECLDAALSYFKGEISLWNKE